MSARAIALWQGQTTGRLILLLCAGLLVAWLSRARRLSLEPLLASTSRGRAPRLLRQVFQLWAALSLANLLIHGLTLGMAFARVGGVSVLLSPIQGLSLFQGSALPFGVGQFIFVVAMVETLGASLIAQIALIALRSGLALGPALLIASGTVGVEAALYCILRGAEGLAALRYANLVAVLDVRSTMAQYRNIPLFAAARSSFAILLLSLGLALLLAVVILLGLSARPRRSWQLRRVRRIGRMRRVPGLRRLVAAQLALRDHGLLVLSVCLLLQLLVLRPLPPLHEMGDMPLKTLYTRHAGRLDAATLAQLEAEQAEVEETRRAGQMQGQSGIGLLTQMALPRRRAPTSGCSRMCSARPRC